MPLYDLWLLHEICHNTHHTTGDIRLVCLPLRLDNFIVIRQTHTHTHIQKPGAQTPLHINAGAELHNYIINQRNLQPSSDQFVCRPRLNVHTEVVLPLDLCASQKGIGSLQWCVEHSVWGWIMLFPSDVLCIFSWKITFLALDHKVALKL